MNVNIQVIAMYPGKSFYIVLLSSLKVFLISTIAFALPMFLTYFILNGPVIFKYPAIAIVFGSFVAYGLIMTIIFIVLMMISFYESGYPITNETLKPRQTRQITVDTPYNDAFERCVSSVSVINKSQIVSVDKEQGLIDAKTGMSLTNYGSKIHFKIIGLPDNRSVITVTSHPVIWWAWIDTGYNWGIVKKISEFLLNNWKNTASMF